MDNSPFSKLPAEIRNQIYELVLCPPGGIEIGIVGDTAAAVKLVRPPPEQKICSLLATCQVIRKECRSILYGTNIFQIDEPSIPADIVRENKAKSMRVERYEQCLRKLKDVLPLIRKMRIEVGTLRCQFNSWRGDDSTSLAERCYALRDAMTMISKTTSVDTEGLLRVDVCRLDNSCCFLRLDSAAAAAAAANRINADHVDQITLHFNLKDLSTLSITAVQQKFRVENQRLQRLRVRGVMTLQQYSTEIVRLHKVRQRIISMVAEVMAMKPTDRTQAPKATESPARQSTGPGLTDDLAMVAGDFYALILESA